MQDILEEKRKIVIFGQGVIGREFHRKYFDDFEFSCYIDNNPDKHNTRYMGLNVYPAEKLLTLKDCAVVVCVRKHHVIAQQLVDLGIKAFWLNIEENQFNPVFMDFTHYESLAYNPRRVVLLDNETVGGNCYAIKKYAKAEDIDFIFTANAGYKLIDVEYYYNYYTSALFLTEQFIDVPKRNTIELWHGFTIKALWRASPDKKAHEALDDLNEQIESCRGICSYSKLYNEFLLNCLAGNVEREKMHITGMPRNDMLFHSDGKALLSGMFSGIAGKKLILYAPTFRKSVSYDYQSMGNGVFFHWNGFYAKRFHDFLVANNMILFVKIHAAELVQYDITESENIKMITDDLLHVHDVRFYELLNAFDLLISDYSSIWVDYLLLDRPIVLAVRDLKDYIQLHGLMVDPLEAWAPGKCVNDMTALQEAITSALFEKDEYCEKRRLLSNIYHKYTDGDATQRVVGFIRETLDTIENGESL